MVQEPTEMTDALPNVCPVCDCDCHRCITYEHWETQAAQLRERYEALETAHESCENDMHHYAEVHDAETSALEATIRELRLAVEEKEMHIEALASDVTLLKEQVRRLEQELTGTRDAWELYGTEKRARVQAEQERDEADAGHADEYRIWVKMIDAETARRKQAEQRGAGGAGGGRTTCHS